jgi:dihydropteroate synthase
MTTIRKPLVMGVLNATPDSFSDGGRCVDLGAGLAYAHRLIAAGADILDIGGESTRPGAEPVSEAEERDRVIPLITALRKQSDVPISIDTMKPAVARAAIEAGAGMWNDITALTWRDDAAAIAAELGCDVVLMHMQGDPRTMQAAPRYADVVGEVIAYLMGRVDAALAAGVARERLWLDPGVGFGKSRDHNLALLAHLDQFAALGFPLLVGASRKSFIRAIDPSAKTANDRLGGSLAVVLTAASAGAAAVRVHDVYETRQALAVHAAIGHASSHG